MTSEIEQPRPTILYVDDDMENLTSFKAVFRRSYEILIASSGAEAIEILRSHDILVLITDQRMPGMSGSELLEIAARDYPDTLRFMLTGFTDYHPLVDAINNGKLHGYFAKPFDAVNIRSRLDNSLKSHYLELENSRLLNKLQQNEHFLDTIIESIPHMISVKEVEHLSFVRFNFACEELLGYPSEELIGRTVYDVFSKEEADHFTEMDRQALNSCKPIDIPEEKIQTVHKGCRWLHTQKIPIMNAYGKPQFLLTISQDITECKKMTEREADFEKQIRQLTKNQALGQLASGVAHDFNNLLSPIMGYTEILQMAIQFDSPLQRHLDKIYSAASRSKSLIHQILTFSREAERKVTPMQLEPVIKEAIGLIRGSFPPAIEILEDIDPDCGLVVADATQIHQIIMNLATNACHAMEPHGGMLTVELKKFQLERREEECFDSMAALDPLTSKEDLSSHKLLQNDIKGQLGMCVCLKVIDTGTGIDQSILDRVFDPYFTTKASDKGTGLGLSVVHGIVKSCGGDIYISSRLGAGTEVTIHFPIHHS